MGDAFQLINLLLFNEDAFIMWDQEKARTLVEDLNEDKKRPNSRSKDTSNSVGIVKMCLPARALQ